MAPDIDRERRLDAIITVAEGDVGAVRAAARQIQGRDGDLAADLRLIARLRETAPIRVEIDAARLRVGQRLTRDIFASAGAGEAEYPLRPLRRSEPRETETIPAQARTARASTVPSLTPTLPGTLPGASYGRRRSRWRRAVLTATAAAALFLAVGGGVTAASAQSLPDSPLYGVKRAEESILLALPLSDDLHAEALGMIAQRRLDEAEAEASQLHDTEVTVLLSDYNGDMRQLIMLAANVSARGGDDSNITAQIAKILASAQAIQQDAAAHGLTAFSKALGATADNIAATLTEQHIKLPGMNGSNGQNNGKGHGVPPKATPTVGPTPTPPGSSGTHDGGGNGSGHGNGSSRSPNDSSSSR
jgi:uncharacterized protein DUF5667